MSKSEKFMDTLGRNLFRAIKFYCVVRDGMSFKIMLLCRTTKSFRLPAFSIFCQNLEIIHNEKLLSMITNVEAGLFSGRVSW